MFKYNEPKPVIKKLFDGSSDKPYREELYREEPQQSYKELILDCGQNAVFAAKTKTKSRAKSRLPRAPEIASALAWHLKLTHAGPDAIKHLKDAALGVIVNRKDLSIIKCETCVVSKAKQIILKRPTSVAEKSYERIHWNLISITVIYNQDQYISYFIYDLIAMNHIYT